MATFRTPQASFHTQVSFIQNGEIGDQTVLNRPLFSLDDKLEFLKTNQDTEITAAQNLASVLGEPYSSTSATAPVWTTPRNFVQGTTHHDAIQFLDAAVSQVNAGSNTTRINNIDTFLIGEDSTTGTAPDWTTARTPLYVQAGDTHHAAINRLDIGASALKKIQDSHVTKISELESQVNTTILPAVTLNQTNIGALQTKTVAVSTLTTTHGSKISTLDSRLVFTRTYASTVNAKAVAISTLTTTLDCFQTKVKSQINLLRNNPTTNYGTHAWTGC